MITISQEEFEDAVDKSIESLPKAYKEKIQNVAFIVQDVPTQEQLINANVRGGLLLGLYEGIPLTQRQGTVKLLPDKISIFKKPIEIVSNTTEELYNRIGNVVWHEVAHYFGLDHLRISQLENKKPKK